MDAQKIKASFLPFVILGTAITIGIVLLFIFFYVAFWGVLVGGVLWLSVLIKNYFFPAKHIAPVKKEGRIIEYDERK